MMFEDIKNLSKITRGEGIFGTAIKKPVTLVIMSKFHLNHRGRSKIFIKFEAL